MDFSDLSNIEPAAEGFLIWTPRRAAPLPDSVCWSDLNLEKERRTGERVWGVCEELVMEFR
jgi:hypothetical protein